MELSIQNITNAPFIPLSASYPYDDKISIKSTFMQTDDGYSFFKHPLFEGVKDIAYANESFFSITSSMDFKLLIDNEIYLDPAEFVLFTGFVASNGKYITNVNGTLYASGASLGPNEFFRLSRTTDGAFYITQNGQYVTVDLTNNNKFTLVLEDKIDDDVNHVQSFEIYSGGTENDITIMAAFDVPEWSPYTTMPIKRFWSYYEGYRNNGHNVMRANGLVKDDDYVDDNLYKFTTSLDTNLFAIGFDGKIVWVKYYNDFLNKIFNKTVDVKEFIEDINLNFLVEYPYKTKTTVTNYTDELKTGNIKLNLLNLKSVMTPEYKYRYKAN